MLATMIAAPINAKPPLASRGGIIMGLGLALTEETCSTSEPAAS